MRNESPYILYGSYASYTTAETRSNVRKKGVPLEMSMSHEEVQIAAPKCLKRKKQPPK
jgi:hypothetical protein